MAESSTPLSGLGLFSLQTWLGTWRGPRLGAGLMLPNRRLELGFILSYRLHSADDLTLGWWPIQGLALWLTCLSILRLAQHLATHSV